jgi:hypothetical protein
MSMDGLNLSTPFQIVIALLRNAIKFVHPCRSNDQPYQKNVIEFVLLLQTIDPI